MSMRREIYRRIALILAVVIATFATESMAMAHSTCSLTDATLRHDEPIERSEREVAFHASTPLLSVPHTPMSQSNFTPAVRTLHGMLRTEARTFANTKAVSSIDSTTATHRYGLYNHKILFASYPRIYYLCRMMRLII